MCRSPQSPKRDEDGLISDEDLVRTNVGLISFSHRAFSALSRVLSETVERGILVNLKTCFDALRCRNKPVSATDKFYSFPLLFPRSL